MTKHITILVGLTILAAACDPYSNYTFKSGPPEVKSLIFVDKKYSYAYEGTGSGGTWTLDITCQAVCDAITAKAGTATGVLPSSKTALTNGFIQVIFDRQVDGDGVQTNPLDCTPSWSPTFTPAAPAAGETWYTCYSPASPTDAEGGSVVLFAGLTPNAAATPPIIPAFGWGTASTATTQGRAALPAGGTDIVMAGSVAGTALNITVKRVATAGCAACP